MASRTSTQPSAVAHNRLALQPASVRTGGRRHAGRCRLACAVLACAALGGTACGAAAAWPVPAAGGVARRRVRRRRALPVSRLRGVTAVCGADDRGRRRPPAWAAQEASAAPRAAPARPARSARSAPDGAHARYSDTRARSRPAPATTPTSAIAPLGTPRSGTGAGKVSSRLGRLAEPLGPEAAQNLLGVESENLRIGAHEAGLIGRAGQGGEIARSMASR